MHEQRSPGDHCWLSDEATKAAVFGLVVAEHPALWTLSELDRCLKPSSEAASVEEPSRHRTEDAVAELYAAGLLHRVGQFVFASRAAVEAGRIADG
jgi:hypothetical protein